MKGMVGMTCMIDRKIEKGEGRGPGYAQQCGPRATAVGPLNLSRGMTLGFRHVAT